uniref:Putative neurotoxin LTDF 10-01 n=1 Tax=Dolomedes fimbriatus TaxID=1432569 RepID=A0A0K1D8E8_9ARAC|nr:putative neurotoxin LTDF 10-01 [Dolomedes fimbriatus]
MRLNIYVFVLAVSLIVLLGVHAERDSNDNAQLTLEEPRRFCAGLSRTCSKTIKCCKHGSYERVCYCSTPAGTNCRCKKKSSEIVSGWLGK